MKTLANKVKGLDKVDLVGGAIGVLVIVPCALGLIIDVIVNGANMI